MKWKNCNWSQTIYIREGNDKYEAKLDKKFKKRLKTPMKFQLLLLQMPYLPVIFLEKSSNLKVLHESTIWKIASIGGEGNSSPPPLDRSLSWWVVSYIFSPFVVFSIILFLSSFLYFLEVCSSYFYSSELNLWYKMLWL